MELKELEERRAVLMAEIAELDKQIVACREKSVHPKYRIRKLTPRECFRLMDVDDKHIDKIQQMGANGKPLISESQQYKMAGNSIVVACLNKIFENAFITTERNHLPGYQMTIFDALRG